MGKAVNSESTSKSSFEQCSVCQKKMKDKRQLRKHMKNIHKTKNEPEKTILCAEDDCYESFCYLNEFRHHLYNYHNYDDTIIQPSIFYLPNKEAFEEWLQEEEIKTTTNFIKTRGARVNKSHSSFTYYCNRTGRYTPNGSGQRQLKAQGSRKMGFHCTADIVLKVYADHVEVKYHSHHYKHDFLLKHVSIPFPVKQTIAKKLALGSNCKEILEDMKVAGDEEAKREHLITRKDIHNIRQHVHIPDIKEVIIEERMQELLDVVKKRKAISPNACDSIIQHLDAIEEVLNPSDEQIQNGDCSNVRLLKPMNQETIIQKISCSEGMGNLESFGDVTVIQYINGSYDTPLEDVTIELHPSWEQSSNTLTVWTS